MQPGMFVSRFLILGWRARKEKKMLTRVQIIKVIEMRDPCLREVARFTFIKWRGYSLVLDGGNGCGIVGDGEDEKVGWKGGSRPVFALALIA